ncbi:DUF6415 family natural product biosynthesis protein [Streptomyces griseomycini]|uniref:Uncharacterized protein n=1 Tax=Streptomyces griseomycini TaxID=66895 RepID=A0A7W7VB04_9ACTN|nr:DUF6415 family natural product biosynthesis protein [Streptomyces griseomycini]MBB4903466.1 hypothetical protein [Streptomyces griseomycini]GGR56514.1 hypothetical protein GCM10015536_71840 [Streptomyces griseomycini]
MTAAVRRWNHPVSAWAPPLDGDALRTVLEKVRQWQPLDIDGLLDDIAAVLDDVPPPEENVEELAGRLRGHLVRLVTVAVAAGAEQDITAVRLLDQARTRHAEDLPGDHRRAVGQLRRMGWTASELLDRLVATRCLREVV